LIQSNQPNLRSLIPSGDLDIRHSVKANINYDLGGGSFEDRYAFNYNIDGVFVQRFSSNFNQEKNTNNNL
jgi:hypothetical protein